MNGLFSVSKNEVICSLYAPVSGTVIQQMDIPDEVFSSGMLGEGIGIIPNEGRFVSPVKGTVIDITPTLHAYSILSDDGAEILIHIGIDTVELKGKGFKNLVNIGDKVDVGTPIANVELDVIDMEGYPRTTAIIIINSDVLSQLTSFLGECNSGKSEVLKCVIKRASK